MALWCLMGDFDYTRLIARLKGVGIEFSEGLTEKQLSEIESFYKIEFPASLRCFYSQSIPVSKGYPRWNDFSQENVERIRGQLHWPLEGLLFDIEHNKFWYKAWGERPALVQDAKEICVQNYASLPVLIPVYGHRFIPVLDEIDDPPILSVYQMDIIYYGANLSDYLAVENGLLDRAYSVNRELPRVPFWLEDED